MKNTFLRLLAPVLILIPFAAGSAQTIGALVVAHGGDSAWNALVRESVAMLRLSGPVELSFLMGNEASKTRFQDAARRLAARGASEVVAVPLLVSSHSGHYEQIRYLSALTDSLDAVMREHLHHGGIERATSFPAAASRAPASFRISRGCQSVIPATLCCRIQPLPTGFPDG